MCSIYTICYYDIYATPYSKTDFQAAGPLQFDPKSESNMNDPILAGLLVYSELSLNSTILDSKVDKLKCHFYRFHVSPKQVDNGFILRVLSQNKDKFKLCIFNNKGEVIYTDNSKNSRDGSNTNSVIYCNMKFNTYNLKVKLPTFNPLTHYNITNPNTTTDSTATSTTIAL